jgi:oxygen-independent coproporphyrinogen III oxidase
MLNSELCSLSTGLYVHLPFCRSKCPYCHFSSSAGRENDIPRYLSALDHELFAQSTEHRAQSKQGPAILDTVYFGGGTPSILDVDQWRSLMNSIRRHCTIVPEAEITAEANPESAASQKLRELADLGVNRLSIGLQAVQDDLLRHIGRRHSYGDFMGAFHEARRAGFRNVNVDLMYGLPGQTRALWRESLRRVAELGAEHVSLYALTVEEGTPFYEQGVPVDDDLQADMYEEAAEHLTARGYAHYEISNFARPGFECRHNLKYWRNQDCRGAGVSAAYYAEGVRTRNTADLDDYLGRLERGRSPVDEELRLEGVKRRGEDIMLGLRLREGVRLEPDDVKAFGPALERFVREGLLIKEGEAVYRPTRRGWLLSNRMFRELI